MTKWVSDTSLLAVAYDTPIPGFSTFNTNCLRMWKALPNYEEDFGHQEDYANDSNNFYELQQIIQ